MKVFGVFSVGLITGVVIGFFVARNTASPFFEDNEVSKV